MTRQPAFLPDTQLFSIGQANNLPREEKLRLYRSLVPREIIRRFGIDPETLADSEGRPLLKIECPSGTLTVELELRHAWDARDPLMYLQKESKVSRNCFLMHQR